MIERSRHDKVDYENRMFVIPVSFNEHGKELLGRSQHFVSKGWVALSSIEHKQMLSHLYLMINQGYLAIPEKYEKLIISLRSAFAKELDLDKTQTSYSDLLDGLRLGLKPFQIK